MEFANIPKQPSLFLEQRQRTLYHEEGYLLFPSLIPQIQLEALRTVTREIIRQSRNLTDSSQNVALEKGHSAGNPRLRRVACADEQYEPLWHLCADSVIPDIAADLVGPNVRFRDLMLNFKWADGGAEVKWHQDFAFYPHTHRGTMQFLLFLEEVTTDQGPLQIIPGSHNGPVYRHYDEGGEWAGTIGNVDLQQCGLENAIEVTGNAGTVSVHHSCTVHGSNSNTSSSNRPALVITYSAADAIPYTAAPYPGAHYGAIVRGAEPGYAHHEALCTPLPPDWSGGYTSIFDHQEHVEDS